ncbi:hypothetical protein RSAG8_05659, partial [Rhizoctonia solani AG-8 WAC10335]
RPVLRLRLQRHRLVAVCVPAVRWSRGWQAAGCVVEVQLRARKHMHGYRASGIWDICTPILRVRTVCFAMRCFMYALYLGF